MSLYFNAVMQDRPMAYYPMTEGQGSATVTYVDNANATESAHNATYHGAVYSSPPSPLVSGGDVATILNNGDYIEFPFMEMWSQYRNTAPFSFECWFLLDATTTNAILFQPYVDNTPVKDNYIGISDGRVYAKFSDASTTISAYDFVYSFYDLPEPRMAHHLVVTFSPTEIKMYVDSVQVDMIRAREYTWEFPTNGYRMIGPTAGTIHVDGIALYRTALTPLAIQNHYLAGRSTKGAEEIVRQNSGIFFPINDLNTTDTMSFNYPEDMPWPTTNKSLNVEKIGRSIGLRDITSPDYVDDNLFFTGGAFQLIPGMKLLTDEQSESQFSVNLIENSSFDVSSDGVTPTGWTMANASITSDANDSQAAIALTNTGNIAMSSSIPVEAYSGNVVVSIDTRSNFDSLLNVEVSVNGGAYTSQQVKTTSIYSRRYVEFTVSSATSLKVRFSSAGSASHIIYIDNAQMELNTFKKYADGWSRYSSQGNVPTIAMTTAQYDSGTKSLKVINNSTTATKFGIKSEILPVDPSDIIYVRTSARSAFSVTDETIEIKIDWIKSDGTASSTPSSTISQAFSNTAWTPILMTAIAPSDANRFTVSIYASKSSSHGTSPEKTIYLDNIYINELTGEAAQYLVVEEMSRISTTSKGSIGLKFYYHDMHNITSGEFAVASMNDGAEGLTLVKKYDGDHKIILRHQYITDGGATNIYDQVIATSPSTGWHTIVMSWENQVFTVYFDSNTPSIAAYDTSQNDQFILSPATELVLGAGIEGSIGLGSYIKDVRVYDSPATYSDYTSASEYGNYYLPLTSSIAIKQSGYVEFYYNISRLYESVDDARIEWGPNNSNIIVKGGLITDPQNVLVSGEEPTPIGGGRSPSTGNTEYYVRVHLTSDDSIYDPALLSYLKLVFLNDVRFKSQGFRYNIIPTGDYNVASRSVPIIHEYFDNGIQFRSSIPSTKNKVVNGGFAYNLDGWSSVNIPVNPANPTSQLPVAYIKQSSTQYDSDGVSTTSCAMISTRSGKMQLANIPMYHTNRYPWTNVHETKLKHLFTINSGQTIYLSCRAYSTVNTQIRFRIIRYSASSVSDMGTTSWQTLTSNQWVAVQKTITNSSSTAKVMVVIETDTVSAGSTVYVTDVQAEASGYTTFENNLGSYMILSDDLEYFNNRIADAEDPYIQMDAGNYLSINYTDTYNQAYLDVATKVQFDDWTPASDITIASSWNASKSWNITLKTTGKLALTISDDGTSEEEIISPWPTTFNDGNAGWIRVIFDGSEKQVTFATSPTGESWTVLGYSQITESSSLYNAGTVVNINGVNSGASKTGEFKFYHLTMNAKTYNILEADVETLRSNEAATINNSTTGVIGFLDSNNTLVQCNGIFSSFSVPAKVTSAEPYGIKTIEFWIKQNEAPVTGQTYFYTTQLNEKIYTIEGDTTQYREFKLVYNGTKVVATNLDVFINGQSMSSNYTFPIGEWTHVVLRIDSTETAGVITSETTGTTRANIIINPTLNSSASSTWITPANVTSTFNQTDSPLGGTKKSAIIKWTSASPPSSNQFGIKTNCYTNPGLTTISFYAKSLVSPRYMSISVKWKSPSGVTVGTSRLQSSYTTSTTSWSRFAFTTEAPDELSDFEGYGEVTFAIEGAVAQNEEHLISMPLFENTNALFPYFDWTDTGCFLVDYGEPFQPTSIKNLGIVPSFNNNSMVIFNADARFNNSPSVNITNVSLYPNVFTQAQALENYEMNVSRGTVTPVTDSMVTTLGATATSPYQAKISDGNSLLIGSSWQIYTGG